MNLDEAMKIVAENEKPSPVERRWTPKGEVGWCVIFMGQPINHGDEGDSKEMAEYAARQLDKGAAGVMPFEEAVQRYGHLRGQGLTQLQIELLLTRRYLVTPSYCLTEPPEKNNILHSSTD